MRRRRLCQEMFGIALGAALPFAAAHAQTMTHDSEMNLDRTVRTFLLTDLLEYSGAAGNPVRFDGIGWIGGDYNRLYLRLEGDRATAERGDELRGDVTYGRLLSPFWTGLAGASVDTRLVAGERRTRPLLARGFEGMSPYFFEVEPMLYVGQHGDVSARFTSSFDVLLTQRLIVQPRVEFNAAVQRVPEFGVGSGLNDVALGARLRYEWRRELAPYVGIEWLRRSGGAARFARDAGERVGGTALVAGVRLWR